MSSIARLPRPITPLAIRPFRLVSQVFSIAFAVGSTGCQSETVNPVPTTTTALGPSSYAGKLDLEIRGTADVTLDIAASPETKVTITTTGAEAAHLLDDGTTLEGAGRFEPLPEAGSELYVAKLSLPPDAAGPCGAKNRSIALSLHHKKGASHFGGALTIYCGDEHYGIPARVLRLSGTLDPK